MTQYQIMQKLSQIHNTSNLANKDELIYDLGESLAWKLPQTHYFYQCYYIDKDYFSPKDLLPGEHFDIDYFLVSNEDFSPL